MAEIDEEIAGEETAAERAKARREARLGATHKRFTPGFFLRLSLSLAILAIAPFAFASTLSSLRADATSTLGQNTWIRGRDITRGRAILELAEQRNPHDPINQFRLAYCILSLEGEKAQDQQFQNLIPEDLARALSLFNRSMEARFKPQDVFIRKAQTARLIQFVAQQANDSTRALEMARVATQEYFNYRHYQGRPQSDVARFYRDAISSAVSAKSFEIAILFWEDANLYMGKNAPREQRTVQEVLHARQFMGEFHMMMTELRDYLMENPNDKAGLDRLQWAVNDARMPYPAWLILRDLKAAGRLPVGAQAAHDTLRDLYSRERPQ